MAQKKTLYILWTTNDPLTVQHMIFMYADYSLRNHWWEHVHIIVWGSAAKLLCDDKALQNELRKFLQLGGEVSVCRRCAEKMGVVVALEALEDMGNMKIHYLGEFFTQILQADEKLLTI